MRREVSNTSKSDRKLHKKAADQYRCSTSASGLSSLSCSGLEARKHTLISDYDSELIQEYYMDIWKPRSLNVFLDNLPLPMAS